MDDMEFLISVEEAGERIDRFLCERFDSLSRNHLQKMIEKGAILVNGKAIKPNYRLKISDLVAVLGEINPQPVAILPENIPLSVIYEDEDILVVDKPKGMVVHPAPGHSGGTLVNAVLFHCEDNLSGINGELRPGIVHRIDKDTTGSLIVCKNDAAHKSIAEQIARHDIKRIYVGIVHGYLKEPEGTIDVPIGRSAKDRKKMAVKAPKSRRAVTHFKELSKLLGGYTYMEFSLETGRTHQIRVHMASIGHPLLGDSVYGPAKCPFKGFVGQALHAKKIGFIHPRSGKYVEFEAPVPEYITDFVQKRAVSDA